MSDNIENLNRVFAEGKLRLVQAWRDTWLHNASENTRRGYITEERSYDALRDFVDGGPVVLVGPGPSLDKAIPYLQKGRHRIIACNSALNPLLANDIQPGIVVCVHPQEEQAEQISEIAGRIDKTAILCVPITIHPRTIEEWPGQVAFFQSYDPAPEYAAIRTAIWGILGGLNGKFGHIVSGGCVASACLETAFHIGFREFQIIGFELGALPDKGVYYGARYDFENGKTALRTDCVRADLKDAGKQFFHWRQSSLYRLAFEQRLEFFGEQDDRFQAWNLSPYSLLEIPFMDMAEALVVEGANGD